MKLKIRKVRESAKLPEFKTNGAVGMDFYASLQGLSETEEYMMDNSIIIMPGETRLVPLGIAVQLEPGYEMAIRPRSSILLKGVGIIAYGNPDNCGTIDSDYRGECSAIVTNNSKSVFVVTEGQRICQGVISKVETPANGLVIEEVEELDETERANKGFGHTGK